VGAVGAFVIVLSTFSFAISGSSFSGGGLIAFTLGIAYLQFLAVFLISLFFPDYISFDELNKVAETVAETVTEESPSIN
jgi:Na+/pantothenate symporter